MLICYHNLKKIQAQNATGLGQSRKTTYGKLLNLVLRNRLFKAAIGS